MRDVDVFEARLEQAIGAYAAEVDETFDAAAIARVAVGAHPGSPGVSLGWRLGAVPRLAWLLLVAALTAALAAGLLLLGAEHRQRLALVPTGIEVLTGETARYEQAVAGGDGAIWLRESGRLVRFDPASGEARTWTVADDAAFADGTSIAPARDGGVWLVGPRTLRLFDGHTFRQALEPPADDFVATEGPDGTLWVAGSSGALMRWDGSAWSRPDAAPPTAPPVTGPSVADGPWVSALAVDQQGRPWIGWSAGDDATGLSRLDGAAWTTFGSGDSEPLATGVWSIRPLSDGSVWVIASSGFARYDGSRWTPTGDAYGRAVATSAVRGSDGSIWLAWGAVFAPDRRPASVTRYLAGTRTDYGPEEGLPSASEVVTVGEEVYAAGSDGLFRLEGPRWSRAYPAIAPTAVEPKVLVPSRVVAVSRDELWAATDSDMWHYLDGTWTSETIDPGYPTRGAAGLALAPDGTVWAAGLSGVAYRGLGGWVVVDPTPASAISFVRDGTAWVAGGPPMDCGGVWTLRPVGSGWSRTVTVSLAGVGASPNAWLCYGSPMSFATDSRGRIWAGVPAGYLPGVLGELLRRDGSSWHAVSEVDGSTVLGATILGTSADDDMWVMAELGDADGSPARLRPMRFDGDTWTDAAPSGADAPGPGALTIAPDGSVWAIDRAAHAVSRFEGGSWQAVSDLPEAAGPVLASLSVAPDGSLFAYGWTDIWRLAAPVR